MSREEFKEMMEEMRANTAQIPGAPIHGMKDKGGKGGEKEKIRGHVDLSSSSSGEDELKSDAEYSWYTTPRMIAILQVLPLIAAGKTERGERIIHNYFVF